ncbi:hypothetical protein BV22DRAFT_905603 [Leucogyrophana mollusca]|uniref:Uncharacterized protein n=1 Tax=Leucogyrophana mollusca TaxID=85980 RepID=A0ACB8AZZ5_9AGAM|nr:hypothetical protein BV22DRAFT_905603 [Leucogyrophana mollusca]
MNCLDTRSAESTTLSWIPDTRPVSAYAVATAAQVSRLSPCTFYLVDAGPNPWAAVAGGLISSHPWISHPPGPLPSLDTSVRAPPSLETGCLSYQALRLQAVDLQWLISPACRRCEWFVAATCMVRSGDAGDSQRCVWCEASFPVPQYNALCPTWVRSPLWRSGVSIIHPYFHSPMISAHTGPQAFPSQIKPTQVSYLQARKTSLDYASTT